MKHLYKCFNHCHSKVLYTFIAMICLNMYSGKYFNTYAAAVKDHKRTSEEDNSGQSIQSEDSEIFACHSRGTFENVHNHNSYWYCDMTPDGGYVAIRRSCPNGQAYDATKRKCASPVYARKIGCLRVHKFHKTPEPKISYVFIVPETTTSTEASEETESDLPDTFTTVNNECSVETTTCTPRTTTCSTTTTTTCRPIRPTMCPPPPKIVFKCDSEGAFPDPESCYTFYICHKKSKCSNVFEKIKVRCPEKMAFDFKLGWCSPQAASKCETVKPAELNKFLHLVNLNGVKYARSLYRRRPRNFYRILRENEPYSIPIIPIHLKKKRHILNYDERIFKNFENNLNFDEAFQCSAKGRFPDPRNRHDYYICYPKELGGYLTLKMKCPSRTSFDVNHLTCTPSKLEPKSVVIL